MRRYGHILQVLLIIIVITSFSACSNNRKKDYEIQIGSNYLITEKRLETLYTDLPLHQDIIILIKNEEAFEASSITAKVIGETASKVVYSGNFVSVDKSNMYAIVSFKISDLGNYYIKIVKEDKDILFEGMLQAK